MNELQLINNNGDVRVSHRNLAEYMGLRQDNVRVTIESHMELFQTLGTVPLLKETVPNGGNGAERGHSQEWPLFLFLTQKIIYIP